jgi:cell division protein FtsI (penicillin-binding protein 3)
MIFQNIKEKIFFYCVIFFYLFFILTILLNNITHYQKKKSDPIYLSNLITSDNVIIATNVKGYMYYLSLDHRNIDIININQFIKKYFPYFKTLVKNNKTYLLGKKFLPIKDIPIGIICKREIFRYYPYGKIFAHPVGISYNNIHFGLELYNRNVHMNKKNIVSDLKTTLIFFLQYHLYNGLKKGMQDFHSEKFHGIIINSYGEIVAISSLPNFDPNNNSPLIHTYNGALSSLFEFGSIFKIFSLLLALHGNFVKKNTIFNLMQGAKIGKYHISDTSKTHNYMTIKDILLKSSNIGTIQIAELIWQSIGQFYAKLLIGDDIYLNKFKLPKPQITYIGAPKYKYLHYCIGYSFSTGMLQVLRAFSSLFTGTIYNPSLIKTNIKENFIRNIDFKKKHTILNILLNISDTNPILRKYKVYGKTGTARININGDYSQKSLNTFYICSFIKNEQRYFMLLSMEKPKSLPLTAASNVKLVAAEIIKNIMLNSINP